MSNTISTNDLITVDIHIEGVRPLLIHRGGLANPLDEHAKSIKEISKKRVKSDADYAELARREFIGSLYWDEEIGPYVPSEMVEATIIGGGKKSKLGSTLKSGLQINEERIPIQYDGVRTIEGMHDIGMYLDSIVKVGQAKTTRRRPMFVNWSMDCTATIDPTLLDVAQVQMSIDSAGRVVGMGDWRPRYGRFTASVAA